MAVNRWTAGMADILVVDWYPVETARGGCSRDGHRLRHHRSQVFTRVRPIVAKKTPGTPVWLMAQTHKNLAPSCHKKQGPDRAAQLAPSGPRGPPLRGRVRDRLPHLVSNVGYHADMKRDSVITCAGCAGSPPVRAGTF